MLLLNFQQDGSLELTLRAELSPSPWDSEGREERLKAEERLLLDADSPWQRRFAALDAQAEELFWRREEGQLLRLVRRAEIHSDGLRGPNGGALAEFWSGTSIASAYSYDPVSRMAELTIYPGPSERAGYREQREVEAEIEGWAGGIYAYLQEVDRLYAYLERRPERAELCLTGLYEDDSQKLLRLTEEENAMLESLSDSMVLVLAAFETVDDDESITWDELSSRVFDPFEARVVVDLPSPALEVEGFVERGGGRWMVPGLSLWGAWQELSEEWVQPNLLMLFFDLEMEYGVLDEGGLDGSERDVEPMLDFEALAQVPRVSRLPINAGVVEEAIKLQLQPAPVYRLSWSNPEPGS